MTRLIASSVLIFGILAAGPASAGAASDLPDLERRALTLHMADLTDCLAYYSIAGVALQRAGARDAAAKLEEVKRTLLDRSFIVMGAIGMEADAALARQRTAMAEQRDLMRNDLANFPALTRKYGAFCKAVVEDPEARLDELKARLNRPRPD